MKKLLVLVILAMVGCQSNPPPPPPLPENECIGSETFSPIIEIKKGQTWTEAYHVLPDKRVKWLHCLSSDCSFVIGPHNSWREEQWKVWDRRGWRIRWYTTITVTDLKGVIR